MSQEVKQLLDWIKAAFNLDDREIFAVNPMADGSGVEVIFYRNRKLFRFELKVLREDVK